jgi:hypothetical protein
MGVRALRLWSWYRQRAAQRSPAGCSLILGAIAFAVGLTRDHPDRFAARYGFALLIWVVGMGVLSVWACRRRLASVTPLTGVSVDTSSQGVPGRAVRDLVMDAALIASAVSIQEPGMTAFALGNGILFGLTATCWRGWELRHGGHLLQEPGWIDGRRKNLYCSMG